MQELAADREAAASAAPQRAALDQAGISPAGGAQVSDFGGGKIGVTAAPGSYGDVSPNFHDDPVVNALAPLPSLAEANRFTGANPTFHGIQRPGDWQRVVQSQMAEAALGPGGDLELAKRQDAAQGFSRVQHMLSDTPTPMGLEGPSVAQTALDARDRKRLAEQRR